MIGLAVLAAYVGFQGMLYLRAVDLGEVYVRTQRLEDTSVEAIPQPFSPFHWMIVIVQKDQYRLAYVSLLRERAPETPPPDAFWLRRVAASYRPAADAAWMRVPRYGDNPMEAALAEQVWHAQSFARYRRFALFPAVYRVDRQGQKTCVWFNDLRFALIGRDMPFRYGACRPGAGEVWKVYRLLNDDNGRELLDAIPH